MQDIRICFIGDSFVNGVGDSHYRGWVGRLCQLSTTPTREITAYNLGIRRDTSVDIARRWQTECIARLPTDSDARVVFSFGVNDTVIESNLPRVANSRSISVARRILSAAAQNYPVLMIGPPPVDDDEQNLRIQALDAAYADLCQAQQWDYLSIFEPLQAEPIWREEVSNNDGSHPRAAGYALLAEMIYEWPAWWFN
ncbi:MAG: GDSL-type esterase/lipase family protein [Thiohalomonadales bacterium]